MSLLKTLVAAIIALQGLLFVSPVSANSSGVVIYQVFAGVGSASQEFVALYNNTDSEVDITGWCLANKSNVKLGCFDVPPGDEMVIGPRQFVVAASESLASSIHIDLLMADVSKITGATDSITLSDATQRPVDVVDWTQNLTTGSALQRKQIAPGMMQDTDVAITDFERLVNSPLTQNLDLCLNIAGVQNFKPAGTNIDTNGHCVAPPIDMCANIIGDQAILPVGYILSGESCVLDLRPLQITELLPNAKGADVGQEYVELYNPTEAIVDLSLYRLQTGVDGDKTFQFPTGETISPGEYKVFYDADMSFSLINTTGRVTLVGADGRFVSASEQYNNPVDDMAWALINSIWQYTDRSSPGAPNLASELSEGSSEDGEATLASCAPGKYRHPLTNRCRNIESDAAVIANCAADQYRNPETGRCRKIAMTASVTPCKEGQYRSEETNRCRNIAVASSLAPCAEGQERNPDTSRCRNVLARSVPDAAFAVQPVQEGIKAFVGWWALGGIGVLAAGYAGWEWRREIETTLRKFSLKGLFKR